MQLFIGGACSGRRDLVAARFPRARWHRLAEGQPLAGWGDAGSAGLVVTGWARWLAAALIREPDDARLRGAWREALDALATQRPDGGETLLILDEMGRGIVPMAAEDRRLRDLNGRLAQDAAARCAAVWYVRHGLARRLDAPDRA